ncbi:sigma-54 interaction domain-containing protein [Desulfotignum balticum]|uniref:sigma-54 interaction domain-containing protein n=1 Tax=Desulfotignum balticum TaxID=115781 RepID=UPI001B7FC49B|nr:sigma-54 dependent transcriptional regulator [Desulfotignum balticum]
MMSNMNFFHQATMKICGSLDVNKMIRDCASYLGRHMPLNDIVLSTYERERGAIQVLAHNNAGIMDTRPRSIPLSSEAQQFMETASFEGTDILQNAELDLVTREANEVLDLSAFSKMVLHLNLDGKRLGVVLFLSCHSGGFTLEHARLIGLLHDPFSVALANVLKHRELIRLKNLLADDNQYLRHELFQISGDEIVGARYGLKDVVEQVWQVASLSSHVMLTGETGVGKEVIANAIHYASQRKDGPFIKINCGAFTENLLDSELFGHEKGAFTGAVQSKRGRFERAHKGTLFLDEVGELSLAAQVRLLRVLQDGCIERVGGVESIKVDARIIAATHRDLAKMVRTGTFREDLWFRLNVFPIHIPPLRQRKSDIPALVHHFIDRKLKAFNLAEHPGIAPGSMEQLTAYPWPGNVRELENMVERSLIRHKSMGEGKPLLFTGLMGNSPGSGNRPAPMEEPDHQLSLDEVMARHITSVLRSTGGRIQGKDGAAAILGVHANTLRSRMDKLGIPYGRTAIKIDLSM